MNSTTRAELLRLTKDFYEFHAGSFGSTRQRPWDSWGRILGAVINHNEPKSILDVGCGNGRFARFVSEHLTDFKYLGVDQSDALLSQARKANPVCEFVAETIDETLARKDTFDLVVAFGLFHHLPGFDYRVEVLNALGALVGENGMLVVSLWRPNELSNFKSKKAPTEIIDLELGDYLLGWENDFSHLRYCHSFDEEEIDRLLEASNLCVLEHFKGRGNDVTNDYLMLTRHTDHPSPAP